jgi:predicted nucleotide-binding protein (sugar kinase/HSP70/actin superfamily)
VSRGQGGPLVDTIFEIGGQDSKFIALENGVVVDFTMNEACAAGTGSFLEEQAEKLGIAIKGEFARLALSSVQPTRLGERCTVFMERDVTTWLHRGEAVPDLLAGLAYSIALNYLNGVVRGRRIGNQIYFQGGTAYNDAVAAAFSKILGKPITVPPYNGVIGAIGMALIARSRHAAQGRPAGATRFRGYDLSRLERRTRDFVCKACSNECDIKEFTIEGQKSYWGDKCSDRYRKPAAVARPPVIQDLFAFRDRVVEDVTGRALADAEKLASGRLSVGIPRAMSTVERYPFWHAYLAALGVQPVLSPATDRRIAGDGVELALASPCYPIQVAHGHVQALFDVGVDYVLVPTMADNETEEEGASHYCPWTQTLPWVVRSAPRLEDKGNRILSPSLHFQLGRWQIKDALWPVAQRLGAKRAAADAAVDAAYAAQRTFQDRLLEAGRAALEELDRAGAPGIVLIGRPYNIYDRNVNCDIPRKLRRHYGANVIPIDFLVTGREPVGDLHENMYWTSGRRMLEAARLVASRRNLHIIYLSNFKCGPDSYIKYFTRQVAGAPLLVLQFDGHGNDAGYLTRCEAYLDSKGILRWSPDEERAATSRETAWTTR